MKHEKVSNVEHNNSIFCVHTCENKYISTLVLQISQKCMWYFSDKFFFQVI